MWVPRDVAARRPWIMYLTWLFQPVSFVPRVSHYLHYDGMYYFQSSASRQLSLVSSIVLPRSPAAAASTVADSHPTHGPSTSVQ